MKPPKPPIVYATVPRLWPGETVVCLATGPSLCAEDVDYCRGRARVIAVKDAIRLAPWADVLYAAGADRSSWYQLHGDRLNFSGLAYTVDPDAAKWAQVLQHTGTTGLDLNPSALCRGKNSGYQAINLAVHLGAARIVLLGYDMQEHDGVDHFFGPRERRPPYAAFIPMFETLLAPLAALGIAIINATRRTALKCFPQLPLAEALA